MREILFRGKRVDNGEWVYGFYHNETSIESHSSDRKITRHHIYTQDFDRFVNAETVGQYTGLTDKNGNKIFEGDIVEDKEGWLSCSRYYINFYDGAFCQTIGKIDTMPLCDREFGLALHGVCVGYEVIGNIHDNPELLEVET